MACGLYKMIMIQKPQRIQPGDSGFGFLLPINPPKIDTLLLHGVKQDGKVCIAKANVRVSAHNFRKKRAFFVKGATVAKKCINKSRTIRKKVVRLFTFGVDLKAHDSAF